MAYVFISEKKLQALITSVVKTQMQELLWGWAGDTETPGLYREFDSLHSRIRALQLKVDNMQVANDALKSAVMKLGASVDAVVAKWASNAGDPAVLVEAAAAIDAAAAKLDALLAG